MQNREQQGQPFDRSTEDEPFRYWTRLGRVRDHLLRHIGEPLSAEDAARIADLSPNYFSTYFRQRVGTSYTRWSHGVRIACAREILSRSDLGITEVAHRVGYRDLRTFERAFKRATGITPRSFRKRMQPRAIRRRRREPDLSPGLS